VIKKFFMFLLLVFMAASAARAEDKQPPKEDEVEIMTDTPSTLVYPSFWHTPFGIHKGTPFWLKVFLGTRTYFNNPQGLACTKLLTDYGKINPGRDDWQLTVYGVNSGNSEVIYNPSMYSLGMFGSYGKGDGQLDHPVGIACNEQGDIYIADTGNNRLSRWFNDGRSVKFLLNLGRNGNGPGEFSRPTYAALDSAGNVYVSDTGNNRIQVFNKSGGFLYEIGKTFGIMNPQGLVVCDSGARYMGYKNDCIYLIDGNNNRIQKLGLKGNLLGSIRAEDVLGKPVFLTTLDMDYYGNVYVVDNLNSQVHKFSPDLRLIVSQGRFGTTDYEFEKPTGITIYRHYGQIFVSDREAAQYFWIGSDARDFKAKKINETELQFDFVLTEKSYATVEIDCGPDAVNKENKILVFDKIALEMGKNSVCWEIPPEDNVSLLKAGANYTVTLKLMSTYSSYPHIEKDIKTLLMF
jgi:hypothetical protein